MDSFTHALLAPPAKLDPALSVGRRLELMGHNAGNLIFQHAVRSLLAGEPLHISEATQNYADPAALDGKGPLVFPAANHLRVADWTGLCNFLEKQKREIVVLGLGADKDDINSLRNNSSVRRLVDILRERTKLVTTRGLRSSRIAHDLGLEGTLPLGCPSIFLNPARDLGQILKATLSRPCPRSAVHAADPFNLPDGIGLGIESSLIQWCIEGAAKLWILPSGGAAVCAAAERKTTALSPLAFHSLANTHAEGDEAALAEIFATKALFPATALGWIRRLMSCDIAFGTRAHGALAALAAGVPGVIVPPDERCRELAQTMHLPYIPREDFFFLARQSCDAARRAVIFDAARFDDWRRSAAALFAQALSRAGLQAAPRLLSLAHA